MRATTLLICSGAILFVGAGVRSDQPKQEQKKRPPVALNKLGPVIEPAVSHKPSQTKPRQSVGQPRPKVTPKPNPNQRKPKVTPKPKPRPEPNPTQHRPKVTPKPQPNPRPGPNKPRPPRVNPSDRKHPPAPDRSHTQRSKPDPRLRPHLPPKPKISDSHSRRHPSDRRHRDDRRRRPERHRWRHHPRHRVIIFGNDAGGGSVRRSRESWDDDGGDGGARSSREGRDDAGVRRSADAEGEKGKTSDADRTVAAAKQTQRLLRLVNATDRSVRVHVQYRTMLDNGSYAWLPAHPADSREAVTFLIAAGKTLDLAREGTPIAASRVRLWVQSTGGTWADYRDKDLWLVPEVDEGGEHYYRAAEMETYTLTLGGQAE
jgi:hypothetical protein